MKSSEKFVLKPKPPNEKTFHTVTLQGGPHGKGLEVWLDGFKLKGVTGLTYTANVADAIRLQIELVVDTGPSYFEMESVSHLTKSSPPPLHDLSAEEAEKLPPALRAIYDDLIKMKEAT